MDKEKALKALECHFNDNCSIECPYYFAVDCAEEVLRAAYDAFGGVFKAENSPSDERKIEGWPTMSADENVGSNREFNPSDISIRGNGKEMFIRLGPTAISNWDYGVSDFLKGLIGAMVILSKE